MSDELARLTTALADRYRIEREIGRGGMATSSSPRISSTTARWPSRSCTPT